MQQLEDRVVIITGASSGLGAQLARAVGEAGGIPVMAAPMPELAPVMITTRSSSCCIVSLT